MNICIFLFNLQQKRKIILINSKTVEITRFLIILSKLLLQQLGNFISSQYFMQFLNDDAKESLFDFIGGKGWESNPPKRLLTPRTSFED